MSVRSQRLVLRPEAKQQLDVVAKRSRV